MSVDRGKTKCGFIGLGSQGAPMARRMIEAGYEVALWARRPASLEPFRGTGAIFAGSVAEIARGAEHVGVCVVDDAGVVEVFEQLLPALPEGARIAVHSTVHPETCRALAGRASQRGVFLVDAPVSGGQPAAEAGRLTIMVGGEPEAVALTRPIFETFGSLIVHLGAVGAGQSAKLVNNALMAANMALAWRALSAGDELGIERSALLELLNASSGRSFALEVYGRLPRPGAFAHGAALLEKDVRLLGELLGSAPAVTALGETARPFIELVRAAAEEAVG